MLKNNFNLDSDVAYGGNEAIELVKKRRVLKATFSFTLSLSSVNKAT